MIITEDDLRKYVGCRDEDQREVENWPAEKFEACERLVSEAMLRLRGSNPTIALMLEGQGGDPDYEDVEAMLHNAVAGEWLPFANDDERTLVIDDVLAHGGVER
jgi:hypothetical protein